EAPAVARAAALAPRISHVDRAWSSPALCARQTAAALGLDAIADAALRDCDFGSWAGRKLAEVHAGDPHAVAAWLADPEATPHGGESRTAMSVRIVAWLRSCVKDTGRIVAVTHASVIRAAILGVLDAPAAAFWRIDVPPLSMVDLSSDGARWSLRAGTAALAEHRPDRES